MPLFRTVASTCIGLTLAIILAAGAVVLAQGGTPAGALAWGLGLAVATRIVPILGSFVVACWPRRDGGMPWPGGTVAARLVGRELWATCKLFFFYHPFEKWIVRHDPDWIVAGETPIVLVHGFYANAGFWQCIKRALAADGWHNLFSLNLDPPFNDIEDYAARLQSRIEQACAACGADAAVVVGHSMGGLVARACARRSPACIQEIVCLGTPHEGTVLASLVPAVNTRQMRRGSEWLSRLNADVKAASRVNIYSVHDNIIVPQSSAAPCGAENTPVAGIGHLDMAFSKELSKVLLNMVRRASPARSRTA